MPLGKVFLFLIFMGFAFPAIAGNAVPPDTVSAARLDVALRTVDAEQLQPFLNDKNYDYGGDYNLPESQGFFQRLWRKILELISGGIKMLRYLPVIIRILLLIAVVIIFYIIATKTKLYKLLYAEQHIQSPEYQEIDPLDTAFDFDKAIRNEVQEKKYRNAVRLLHLNALKYLGSKEIVQLSKDKTNRDYTFEIANPVLRSEFASLTGVYNQVWYGKYALVESAYIAIAEHFNRFAHIIDADKE
jgi:hypothetical protein